MAYSEQLWQDAKKECRLTLFQRLLAPLQLWQDAKKECRLTDEDIARAKRLGLNPRSLIKNIPSKREPWKAPVSEWLREMEEKWERKSAQRQARKARDHS